MIQIREIEIEGFCGIVEPFSYKFDMPGINLIWGLNGSGKSTIFNALAWGLYGKLLKPKRSIVPWKTKQKKSFRGTRVEVSCWDDTIGSFRVHRYKDFKGGMKLGSNDVEFVSMGKNFPGRKKAEIEKAIERTLGVSFELFKASVTFGQNLTRFLKLPSGSQKEILDEAFAINYINDAKDKAKKELETLLVASNGLKAKVDVKRSVYGMMKENIDRVELLKKQFNLEKGKKLKEIREGINASKESITKFEGDKLKRKELQEVMAIQKLIFDGLKKEMLKLKAVESEVFKLDFDLSNHEAELKELKEKRKASKILLSSSMPKCMTCGQLINEAKRVEQRNKIKKLITTQTNEILVLENTVANSLDELKKLRLKVSKHRGISVKRNEAEKIYNKAFVDNANIGDIDSNIKTEKKNKNLLINKLRETLKSRFSYDVEGERNKMGIIKRKVEFYEGEFKKIEREVKLHQWVINDPLSNKGIKAYIFSLMIQKINIKLNEYGRKVGFGIKLAIDLDSANKTFNAQISKGNQIISYDDLSGGEEQLVDVCLGFAMHDVVSNNRFNILLLDEVFESLDKENIDLIYEIISYKSKSVNTHLITHRKSFMSRANAVIQL